MLSSKTISLTAILAVTSLGLSSCSMLSTPAAPLTEQEQSIKNDLATSNFMPASREVRDNIETQELFAQAAFWSREYDLNPSDLEATIKLASVIRKLGNPARAAEVTQMARALYPRDPYLGAEFAAALIADERAPEAIPVLDEMLRTTPGYARLWSLKGAALDQTEQYDTARKHYSRALQITPHDPNILTNIGLSYALSGDPATAEGWLRRAAAIPGAGDAVIQNLNLILQLQGKPAETGKNISAQAAPTNLAPRPAQVTPPQAYQRPAYAPQSAGYPQTAQIPQKPVQAYPQAPSYSANPNAAGAQAQQPSAYNNRSRRRR